jgi:hypothetical protein
LIGALALRLLRPLALLLLWPLALLLLWSLALLLRSLALLLRSLALLRARSLGLDRLALRADGLGARRGGTALGRRRGRGFALDRSGAWFGARLRALDAFGTFRTLGTFDPLRPFRPARSFGARALRTLCKKDAVRRVADAGQRLSQCGSGNHGPKEEPAAGDLHGVQS